MFQLEEKGAFGKALDYSMELSDDQYKALSENAVVESKQYDVGEIIKKWVALFEKVCSKCIS